MRFVSTTALLRRYSPSLHPPLRLFSHAFLLSVSVIRQHRGAKICPRQPRHASVMDGPVSESRIWFINAGAYTVMTLGGGRGEKGAEFGIIESVAHRFYIIQTQAIESDYCNSPRATAVT
jgi:hypothetical protein